MDKKLPKGNWSYPTNIRLGAGRIAELPEACRSLGITNPLLVTDPGLAALPLVKNTLLINEKAGLQTAIFSSLRPNPVGKNVEDGVRAYRGGNHDGIIAFGGGSALDIGKAIALMAGQKRPIWDFEDSGENWKRADAGAIAPVVAIPTTAGTGSEVGRASIITNEEIGAKKIIFHPKMLPGVVISDPELTVGLPANLTAWTGMDALAHCLEAYCTRIYHPLSEGIALEGMRLVKEWLPVAFRDGADLEARTHLLAAASMGAIAFQKGLGAIHALSHPVGAIHDTHHGLTNAVFTPYVLMFNREAIGEKMERLGAFLNLEKPNFQGVLDWIMALRSELEIPHTLAELGVPEEGLDRLAEMAIEDPTAAANPVRLGLEEAQQILGNAMAGKLETL